MTKTVLLIRGARILQQIAQLDESTYVDLERQTLNFEPPSQERQNAVNQVRISKVELVPSRESQTLTAKLTVDGGTSPYQPTILFSDVIYEDSDQSDNTSFTAVDGEEYHIMPIPLNKSTVKVSCNCLDFYYRFAAYNNRDDSLYGNPPPPYQRRTMTRPPVNPKQTPGVCKHLMKSVIALKDVRIVT
jgi:hypothetical protein